MKTAILALLCVLLTACGGGDSPSDKCINGVLYDAETGAPKTAGPREAGGTATVLTC